MVIIQRRIAQILLLLLSLVGIGIAAYLTAVHYDNTPLICSANGVVDCARVLSSTYSFVPGTSIPVAVPGIAWCILSAALAIIGLRLQPVPRWLRITQFALALSGMLAVMYLVYVEIVRLHTICAWCTGLHVVILIMFLITLFYLQEPSPTQNDPRSEVESPKITTGLR